VVASLIIHNGSSDNLSKLMVDSNFDRSDSDYKPLLSVTEAAEYLGISEYKLKMIISSEQQTLQQSGSYSGKMMPYIEMGNEIYISKAGLTAWIEEATQQRKEY